MEGNLGEFLKVFVIVVTFASGILSLRHFITNMETDREESEEAELKVDRDLQEAVVEKNY